jgi:hypothetical protein
VATVPNPQTWVKNTVPTATNFNTEIRDATNFCTGPQRVLVRHAGTNPDLLENTWTLLAWDTTVTETEAGMHDGAVNNSRLTAVTGGYYQVWMSSRWEPTVFPNVQIEGARAISVEKNAVSNVAGTGDEVCSDRRACSEFVTTTFGTGMASCTGFVRLNPGDFVQAFAWQGDNANIEFSHGVSNHNVRSCFFGMVWIAP